MKNLTDFCKMVETGLDPRLFFLRVVDNSRSLWPEVTIVHENLRKLSAILILVWPGLST